uniref:Uncharacterized protein n=1 Tax=Arundo donax TaxID=35708 RepID=A0A0A9BTP8_ARUDO
MASCDHAATAAAPGNHCGSVQGRSTAA